ncbi:hypothetical protein T08_16681 [Trichinella sp. T8]|nr:hypothetical protein T08_16681 [Trichinella sp. T8]
MKGLEVIRSQQLRTTTSSDKPPQRSQKAAHRHVWTDAQLIELFKEPIQAFLADDQLLRILSCSGRHYCCSILRSLAFDVYGSEDQNVGDRSVSPTTAGQINNDGLTAL